jgi:membrane protein DedA with SNARE-associated domain
VLHAPRLTSAVLFATVGITLTPAIAHAQYLDPGAGSIIVQAVIAVVVGAAATVRLYWHRISPFLHRRKDRDQS